MCFSPKYAFYHYHYDTIKHRLVKSLSFNKFNPKRDNEANQIIIPCGKCLACKIDQANSWATRCLLEAKKWTNNCFITLTYNEENINTKNGINTLNKKDIQDFFKLLRYYENRTEDNPIRYFACGEYGDKTFRPHYHLGVFNYIPKDLKFHKLSKTGIEIYTSKTISDIWKKGFITVQYLNYEAAAYIARYTQKKINRDYDKKCETLGIEKEFKLTSRRPGIALDILNDKETFEKMRRNFGFLISTKNGVKLKGIPQALKKRWRDIDEFDYYEKADKHTQKCKENMKKILAKTSLNEKEYRIQQAKLTEDRLRRLKRNQI